MPLLILFALQTALGQAAPEVIVQTVEGPRAVAPLLEIAGDFTVKLGGKSPAVIPGGDLIALRHVGVAYSGACRPPLLLLTTGDRVPVSGALTLDDETLHATLAAPLAMDKVALPQAALAAIIYSGGDEILETAKRDTVVLKNGDRLAGKLAGLDAAKASLVVGDKSESIPLDRIARIDFNGEYQSRPKAKGASAEAFLIGGARLALNTLTSAAGGELSGVNRFGQRLAFPAAQLAALRIRNGKAVYLDDLKPAVYESTPFLDVKWPLTTGHTVAGRPLKIGDNMFPYGLGMHSRSRATYALDGGDRWFEALVAVDAANAPRGMVRIDVEVDGKPAPGASHLLQAGGAAVPVRVDVRGARTLTLVTDFGPRGDVQGHAIWADARLIRK